MIKMNLKEKEEIRVMLRAYAERYPSQNRAVASLQGISPGTMSNILNGKFENISDEMWRQLRAQVSSTALAGSAGTVADDKWKVLETPLFRDVTFVMGEAQAHSDVTWVVAPAGSGKTCAAEHYAAGHKGVFYLLCDEDMKKYDFIRELARVVGIRFSDGKRIRDLLMTVIQTLNRMESPLLILDEGDKLNDNILYYFITLYNRLKDKTGIVFLSTSYMKRRMASGINYDKKGYQEIESRIGRRFFEAELNGANEVMAIARANGITDEAVLKRVLRDAEDAKWDLRRVYKKVMAERRRAKIAVNGEHRT